MKAILLDRVGAPETSLRLGELPIPQPGPGEVRVRMLASPINPSDLLYIQGQYGIKPPAFPAVPGFEGVGIVEATGGGLLGKFRMGKRVAVLGSGHGNWAEFTVVKARQVFPVPSEIPDDQAAGFFVNPLTAYALLTSVLKIQPGEWLLQSAANGALAQMIVRLAKVYGFKTINLVRRADAVDELKKLGADHVIVEGNDSIPEAVAQIVGSTGLRCALDPVGGSTGAALVQSLSAGGTAVLYGLLSGQPVPVDPRFLITGSKCVRGFWLSDWAKQQGVLKMLMALRKVRSWLKAGIIRTEIAATYPLDQYAEAIRTAMAPGKAGKVVFQIAASKGEK